MPFGLNFFGQPKKPEAAVLATAVVQKSEAREKQLADTLQMLNVKADGINKQCVT